MARRSNGPGFMLLLTLVLLALVAVLMLGLSRRSVARAVEAQDEVVELQRRWGVASLRHTLIVNQERAEALLDEANRQRAERREPPAADRRGMLALSGADFAFVLADEQAKANVNIIVGRLSSERARQALRDATPMELPASTLHLSPDPRARVPEAMSRPQRSESDTEGQANQTPNEVGENGADAAEATLRDQDEPLLTPEEPSLFGGWGQVFPGAEPAALLGFTRSGDALAGRLTLWGDGRLCLRRASPEALQAVAAELLTQTQVRRVIDARDTNPEAEPVTWLQAAEPSDRERQTLGRLLTSRSRCFSLAIQIEDEWRRHYVLITRERLSQRDGDPEPETEKEAQPRHHERWLTW